MPQTIGEKHAQHFLEDSSQRSEVSCNMFLPPDGLSIVPVPTSSSSRKELLDKY
jgi:hypothetical protein